ncbi:nucleoside deaminase, partial [Neisseria meningitidis]|uniref:nucleoside deaminase n=1 Tax=Neisseria meningitidis TaxID=487 RepID=UPI000CCA223E
RHAETNALAQAGSERQNSRLDGGDIYSPLDPCAMCASALIQARIKRVIYGAAEPKTGAAGSIVSLFADKRLNPRTAIRGGILQ